MKRNNTNKSALQVTENRFPFEGIHQRERIQRKGNGDSFSWKEVLANGKTVSLYRKRVDWGFLFLCIGQNKNVMMEHCKSIKKNKNRIL